MKGELRADILAGASTDEEMANRCLRILEFYLNDHKEKNIKQKLGKDGSVILEIVRKENGTV